MPNLACGVCNCAHNDNRLCSLNSINVSGGATSSNTCCDSFAESNGMTNCASGCGTPETSVHCEAHDCKHNENCSCHADNIDVCSYGDVCNCKDTECGSFCKR